MSQRVHGSCKADVTVAQFRVAVGQDPSDHKEKHDDIVVGVVIICTCARASVAAPEVAVWLLAA